MSSWYFRDGINAELEAALRATLTHWQAIMRNVPTHQDFDPDELWSRDVSLAREWRDWDRSLKKAVRKAYVLQDVLQDILEELSADLLLLRSESEAALNAPDVDCADDPDENPDVSRAEYPEVYYGDEEVE